eukprot:scaffold78813_cov87-Phaeocystis_antarctica.AAC.1
MCPAVSCLRLVHESASSRLLLVRHYSHLGVSQRSGRERLAACIVWEGTSSVYIAGEREGRRGGSERGRAGRD